MAKMIKGIRIVLFVGLVLCAVMALLGAAGDAAILASDSSVSEEPTVPEELYPALVCIFPCRVRDAGIVYEKIKALGLYALTDVDPIYRKLAYGPYNVSNIDLRIWYINICKRSFDVVTIVDPELNFTAEDIADDFCFGNGVAIGGVNLKDGTWRDCGFIVLDQRDKAKAEALWEEMKAIFLGIS